MTTNKMNTNKRIDTFTEQLQLDPPLYYYEGQITVCLLTRTNKAIARGIAICSPLDQFTKREGRAKALGRAVQALVKLGTTGWINPARFARNPKILSLDQLVVAKARVCAAAISYGWKSAYCPALTTMETRILSGNGKNK